ncbi:plastocyanin/azurin family copper-binding protein [Rhizorhabdus histidinilytica]|uniref:plastocyanin/azurin family copper-binding protein n=1 Tax=Rhizorhabdus histidinilytica TaxID=439228 RepID=UPI001AD986B7|nr:plastocyanin/azurin family copper-binding protein [Rhizorhabdus histidinilytica]
MAVGDRVIFKATNPSHDAASIPTMLPAGAKPFTGKISQDVTVTFTVPGFYGIKCTPHFGMGMVALIKVGKPTNGEQVTQAAAKLPPMARKRLLAAFAKAK